MDENLAAVRAQPVPVRPTRSGQQPAQGNALRTHQKLLGEFEKLPSITPAIYMRLGRCFYELDRKWEAVVVYQEILDRFKEGPEREPALFGLIVSLADVNQPQKGRGTLRAISARLQERTERRDRRLPARRGCIAGERSEGRGNIISAAARDASRRAISAIRCAICQATPSSWRATMTRPSPTTKNI